MIPVLIDCDPGQDDAIALLLALASPELEIVGVTTVAGNQTVDKTTVNALKVLELAGRSDIPVARGADRPLIGDLLVADDAHGTTGLDGPDLPAPTSQPVEEHAVDFLAKTLGSAERPLALVAIGPLTNVALLLAGYPEAARKIERIVLMGGAIGAGNQTASAEFNIWTDPEAAFRVFESGLDLTMIGLDVTNKAVLTAEDAAVLRGSGPVGDAVAAMLDFYLGFYTGFYEHGGAPIHDAVAVAHVFRPELVTTLDRHVAIERGAGLCRGRTVVDMRRRTILPDPNSRVGVDIDVPTFRELLLGRLASLDEQTSASRPRHTR
jgi:inosine-uridine nucleoside N-ribohydrolase